MNNSIIIVVLAFMFLAAMLAREFSRTPSTTSKVESDVVLRELSFRVYAFTDPKTGIEYLVNSKGGLVKR